MKPNVKRQMKRAKRRKEWAFLTVLFLLVGILLESSVLIFMGMFSMIMAVRYF